MIRATCFVLVFLVAGAVVAQSPEPVRLSSTIAGERSVIEVRDLPRAAAESAIRSAFDVMAKTLGSLDGSDPESELAQLNRASGGGLMVVSQEFLALLQKALGFCLWSRGAQGPLGGLLYALWGDSTVPPSGDALLVPRQTASCSNLKLHPETQQASLSSGARLDLRHFSAGHAVDLTVDRLQKAGAGNIWVEHGSIARTLGPGPDGLGWSYSPPMFAGMSQGIEPVRLQDKALSAVSAHRERFRLGELDYAAFIDQRSGQPVSGIVAVLVATPLAVDAQALATTMMILGNREGQLRLVNVVPTPSAIWLLGDGTGEPLITTYKWSLLTTR